jgi:hypothetical protein
MKLAVLSLLLSTGALLATTGTAAARDTSVIDSVQAQQRYRIERGRYTGALTRHEYRQLKAEQAHIAAMERRAKADGYVSYREYRAIRNAQHAAAQHIYAEIHDGQVSHWRRWLYRHRY